MKKPGKPKFSIIVFLLITLIVILGVVAVAPFTYENRCYVIRCSPASWEEILDTASKQAQNNFRIDDIYASPAQSSSFTENGPEFLTIHVMYVSTESDASRAESDQPEINHPEAYCEFDDRNLKTVTPFIRRGWRNLFPSEDGQKKLRRITITPRDAIRITWTMAKEYESLMPLEDSVITANLIFDDFYIPFFEDMKKNGGEPMWIVSYNNEKFDLTYHVSAYTGQVIATFIQVHSK